jgi:pSer/pThr/pTyr-binding forkhead associated (FHA) protein
MAISTETAPANDLIDYYALIDVPENATPEEIRRAYREKVQEYQSDQTKFAGLSEAYEVLKDTARRAAYDRNRKLTGSKTARSETGEPIRMTDTDTGHELPETPTAPVGPGQVPVLLPTQQVASPAAIALPSVCAMDLAPCPLLSRSVAPDEGFCPECGFLLGSSLGTPVIKRPLPKLVDVQGREFPLKLGENIVGREGADVMIPHNTVSRKHARIQVDESGAVSMEDLGSTNGCRIAGAQIPKHQRTGLRDRMVVQFGGIKLTIIIPEPEEVLQALPEVEEKSQPMAAIVAPKGDGSARLVGKAGNTHVLMAEKTTFGRRPGNTVVISDDSYISGNHCHIVFEDNRFILIDLGSTNGTQVNGKRLEPHVHTPLRDGDLVIMGQTEFVFHAPSG